MSEDTDETSFEDNYLEAVAAVRAHPGSIEHEKTLAPRTMAVGVVRPDYLELVAFLERLERDPGLSMIVASNTP
ncbi:MAG: hypothetical protein JWN62_3229, partial [Acidimicrobiales bacterium]|nr:hypothetical protein [Acidimicrobiales bacterium]